MQRQPTRTLAIWLPDWPVQHARLERRELVGRPLVISASDGGAEWVAACSQEARELGVSVGMKTPDAESLAGPGRLTRLTHEPTKDRLALTRLASDCERFSPTVALEDVDYPDALLLDVTGLAFLWGETVSGGESSLAREVIGWFGRKHLHVQVAMAPSPGCALAITRYGANEPNPVVADATRAAAGLPVEALRVDDATVERLKSLGIETIGALAKLPRSTLPARFGQELIRRLDQFFGSVPESLVSVRRSSPVEATWAFENAVRSGQVLSYTTGRLVEQIGETLRERGRGALRVLFRYQLEGDEPSVSIVVRLFRPTASARELHELVELQTDGVRFPSAVSAIHVVVGSTAPIEVRQKNLFEDSARDDPHETAKLIHRLAGRVGFDRVCRVEKHKSIDPRRAYALLPATDAPPQRFALTPFQAERLRRAPLAMTDRPVPRVRVRLDTHGSPIELGHQGVWRVVRSWGPERIETGWWRGRGVRRDAWWVELENGSRLWLCHDLRGGRWSLAGEFF